MCMRRRVASSGRGRPVVPVGPTTGGAASYSAVKVRRGQRTARGPSSARGRRRLAEHAARCRSHRVADGVVNQVGPSGTAHGSSDLVKAHTPRRGRPSCRNIVYSVTSRQGPAHFEPDQLQAQLRLGRGWNALEPRQPVRSGPGRAGPTCPSRYGGGGWARSPPTPSPPRTRGSSGFRLRL